MPARLSVCLSVCLLLAASEVIAQDATPASSPTSAPASMPQSQEAPSGPLTLAQEQARLEKKLGISLDKITPELRKEFVEKGVLSSGDLLFLLELDDKKTEEGVLQYSQTMKKQNLLVGTIGHTLRLPLSFGFGVGGLFLCADTLDDLGACFLFSMIPLTITTSLASSLVMHRLQERGLPSSAAKEKRLSKYTKLSLASAAAIPVVFAGGFLLQSLIPRDEVLGVTAILAAAIEVVAPPVMTYLHYKAIQRDVLSMLSKQSALPEKQARLQLDLSPMVLPTYDGKFSTGLGIVGSW